MGAQQIKLKQMKTFLRLLLIWLVIFLYIYSIYILVSENIFDTTKINPLIILFFFFNGFLFFVLGVETFIYVCTDIKFEEAYSEIINFFKVIYENGIEPLMNLKKWKN